MCPSCASSYERAKLNGNWFVQEGRQGCGAGSSAQCAMYKCTSAGQTEVDWED